MLNMLSGVFQNLLIWSDTVCTTFRLFFTAAPVGWRPVVASEGIKLPGSYINGSEENEAALLTHGPLAISLVVGRGILSAAYQTLESASCSPLAPSWQAGSGRRRSRS